MLEDGSRNFKAFALLPQIGLQLLVISTNAAGVHSEIPAVPYWPLQFTSNAVQNRSGVISLATIVYDWPGGRNLVLTKDQQSGSVLWDMEWTNGTSFFFDREVNILLFNFGDSYALMISIVPWRKIHIHACE